MYTTASLFGAAILSASLFVAPAALAQASVPAEERAELVFWESVRDSRNPADFQEYLRQYPNGRFAALARNRLAALAPADWERGYNWYVGVGLGSSVVKFADDFLATPGSTTQSFSKDETGHGFKAYVGHRLFRYLAVEGGYINLGEFAARRDFSGPALFGPGSISLKLRSHGLFADAVGLLPVGERVLLFLKGGVLLARTKADVTTSGSASFVRGGQPQSGTDTSPGFKAGGGASFDMSSKLAIRVEYEQAFNVGDAHTTGQGDIGFLSIGGMYRF
jgi:OOP family OmpA-OmpF porin